MVHLGVGDRFHWPIYYIIVTCPPVNRPPTPFHPPFRPNPKGIAPRAIILAIIPLGAPWGWCTMFLVNTLAHGLTVPLYFLDHWLLVIFAIIPLGIQPISA